MHADILCIQNAQLVWFHCNKAALTIQVGLCNRRRNRHGDERDVYKVCDVCIVFFTCKNILNKRQQKYISRFFFYSTKQTIEIENV